MANDINKEDPHYKGEYGSIYEVNRKFPTGGVAGDFVVIDGWAHYWNADRGTWCVNAERDSYWDELITNIIEKFKLVRGATYMGVASLDTVPTKVIGAKMYYFATVAGTYKNFGGLVVPQGINVLYSENGSSWVNTTLLEVAQELGVSTNKVVSQKAVSDKLSDLAEKKFDKENIAQEFGDSEDKVVSQFALPFREIESPEFIKVIVDANDHLLFTINLDGEVDWGKGIPAPIKAKFQEIINQCQQDKTDLLESINTLKGILDKTTIKDEEGIVFDTPFRYIQNEEFIFAKVDAEDRLLFGIEWDGTPKFGKTSAVEDRLQEQVTLLAEKVATIMGDEDATNIIDTMNELKKFFAKIENTETLTSILANLDKTTIKDEEGNVQNTPFRAIESPEYLAIETDAEDKVLAATYPDGSHYAHNMRSETIDALENKVSKINDDTKSLNDNVQNISQKIETISGVDVYSRNANNIPLLQSACRYNNGKKDFLMCIIADSHSEEQAVQNAVALTNKIDVIDAIIHCGDITASHFDKTQILNFYNDYKHCEKPWLVVIGNHDVGNTMYLQYSATHEEIFQYYIKPMIDGGILNNGEYQEGKPYYFHDFTDRKIRVIVPYEYDNPLDVADNEYWNSIDYDGSLPQLVPGKTYSVGDKVNSGGYKDNSFICKKEVVTINSQYDNNYTIPYYKSGRAARVISKEQAEWLVNTLKSTPDEYGVIIATHNPAMLNSTNQINSKFAVDTAYKGVTQGQYAMETDLISEIVNAFIKKIQLSLKVVMKSANWYKADASYMNILGDTGEKYAYQIEADFSHIQNCYFACYVGGHSHKDLVFKHDTYESQYGINPVCASTDSGNRGQADIVNINVDSLNYDALTCISVSKGRIALSRLGNQLSINGKHRDIEIIKI